MDKKAAHIIYRLEHSPIQVDSLELTGSRTQPDEVDQWSDIDLTIRLKEETAIDQALLQEIEDCLGKLIGLEVIAQSSQCLLRAVMLIDGEVELLDLKIIQENNSQIATPFFEQESVTQKFWFLLFLATKKFMRSDFLIGTHLLMDCMKMILVLEMQKRDRETGTNMHRFGGEEHVNEILNLDQFTLKNQSAIQVYLLWLANRFDDLYKNEDPAYIARYDYLVSFIDKN